MTQWMNIESAPEDTLILLRRDFDNVETPMVVVGEVTKFRGELHHLWRGPYDGVIKEFSNVGNSEEFTHWAYLGDLL